MIFCADIVLPVTSPPVKDGAVLVKDGRIVAVGDRRSIFETDRGEDIYSFENSILMPGLVNLHGHLECSSFDFLAEPTPFSTWLGKIIEVSRKMGRDDWLHAARRGIRKYLEAGITCAADITRSGAGIQAIAEVDMPAVVYLEAVGVDERNLAESVVDMLENIKSYSGMSEAYAFRVGLSPHSPYTLSSSALKAFSEIAKEYDLALSMHLAETLAEVEMIKSGSGPLAEAIGSRLGLDVIEKKGSGKTTAAFLDDFGLVTDRLVAAHGIWLEEADIELLKKNGAAVALCPTSNELLGVGKAYISRFVENGLKFGFGTDSLASNPDLDIFLEMKKARALLTEQMSPKADVLAPSPKRFIEMVTVEAADILGFGAELGSIEPGKRADFASIDYDMRAAADPYDYLLEHASKELVSHTVLGGEIVYRRR